MTRHEKKEELIGLFLHGAITIGDLIDECFEFEQQQPRWISVEDELPPYGQQVLVYSERDPWAEMWWSNRYTEDGARFGEDGKYQVMTDNNGFATLRDDDNEPIQVTHWMLVKPPKKGGEQ